MICDSFIDFLFSPSSKCKYTGRIWKAQKGRHLRSALHSCYSQWHKVSTPLLQFGIKEAPHENQSVRDYGTYVLLDGILPFSELSSDSERWNIPETWNVTAEKLGTKFLQSLYLDSLQKIPEQVLQAGCRDDAPSKNISWSQRQKQRPLLNESLQVLVDGQRGLANEVLQRVLLHPKGKMLKSKNSFSLLPEVQRRLFTLTQQEGYQ